MRNTPAEASRLQGTARAWRRALLVVAASFLVLMLASQAGPPAPEAEATSHVGLLPDLQTLPPRDIEIVLSRPGPKAERRLRFDNRIWNAGAGPVEAYPVSRDCDGDGDARKNALLYSASSPTATAPAPSTARTAFWRSRN